MFQRIAASQPGPPLGRVIWLRLTHKTPLRFTYSRPPARVSSPGESHPEALVEPYMSLSTHTAPIAEPCRTLICQ